MNVPVGPKRNTAQNGVPNGVHPILLKHFKELGGGSQVSLARKRHELVSHTSLGLVLGGPAP